MFTGIISSVGTVLQVSSKASRDAKESIHVRIRKPTGWKIKLGESISVDGVCSTIKGIQSGSFEVEYMPETLKKTTAGLLTKNSQVNLERSLQIGDRLDGHLVQGHVDTTGRVREIRKVGDSIVLTIDHPKEYSRFIAQKGSITLNGVSLTVVTTRKNYFTVSLVSYTLTHTNLCHLKKNDKVNLEVDVLARYLDALNKK